MDILIDSIIITIKDFIFLNKKLGRTILRELGCVCPYFRILFNDRPYVKKHSKLIFKYLKLKPIPLKFEIGYDSCCFNSEEISLTFGCEYLIDDTTRWDTVFNYLNREFKIRNDKLFFIVCHEIAHYLQFSKYPKWQDVNAQIYLYERRKGLSHKQYRNLKLEKNADRIALILCKEFNKGV